ncbi:MAG: phosphoglycerate kinase [Chloroflexota bacterium]|nr:phosphoglycerate kinase [Chloroflexota bacterium]
MPKRSIAEADLAGKRVLVRVDFNVPLSEGAVGDDTRIRASLPTIQYLIDHRARTILVSHLGRPRGKPDAKYRMAPVAKRLSELLGRDVATVGSVVGPEAAAAAEQLAPGEVLLLENVRFEAGEEQNDPALAKALAALADLFVNDAFGTAHRAHASTVGVARELPAYAGFLLQREVDVLSRLLDQPERPFVAILGGAKISDKLAVAGSLLKVMDTLLIGGGMANTFLLATGVDIGESLAERERVDDAKQILAAARATQKDILLPVDVVIATDIKRPGRIVEVAAVPASESIFDIGPATITAFEQAIAGAKTIFWNGPMGVFEQSRFAAGTRGVARAVAGAAAYTVIGGGDSVAAVEQAGLADRIDHISTGGGASLELLEGTELPGLAAIPDIVPRVFSFLVNRGRLRQ